MVTGWEFVQAISSMNSQLNHSESMLLLRESKLVRRIIISNHEQNIITINATPNNCTTVLP
jgi:hypothetical protein